MKIRLYTTTIKTDKEKKIVNFTFSDWDDHEGLAETFEGDQLAVLSDTVNLSNNEQVLSYCYKNDLINLIEPTQGGIAIIDFEDMVNNIEEEEAFDCEVNGQQFTLKEIKNIIENM